MKLERYNELVTCLKELHGDQTDYTGRPYWVHCSRVFEITMIVLNTYGHNTLNIFRSDKYDDLIITSLFHDVIEDVADGEQKLKSLLTKEEYRYNIKRIKELSKPKNTPYNVYINSIIRSLDWIVILTKFGDLVDHVERLPFIGDEETQKRLTEKYLEPLKHVRMRTKQMLDFKADNYFHLT